MSDIAPPSLPSPSRPQARWRVWLLVPAALALLVLGAVPRLRAQSRAEMRAAAQQVPQVRIVQPQAPGAAPAVTLPATLQAWSDAAIRARDSGYVAQWSADIGRRVTKGQTLALLVAPELDAALRQARSDAATARANFEIAQTSAQRWQEMLRTKVTSQQEVDQKAADLAARRAQLDAAEANVARLAQTVAYTRIVAPFDGVVTARAVDVGTLVDAGAAGELFHEMQTARLRVVVSVPDDLATAVRPGLPVRVDCGGRVLGATIARSAGALDAGSRTLRAEIDLDNADGGLLPGQYVQVHLQPDTPVAGSLLPIETVLFRPDGPTLAVVGDDGRVHLQRVRIARDFGTRVIVEPALPVKTQVVVSPGDAIVDGQAVQVASPTFGPRAS